MKTKQSNNSATVADAVKIASQRALQPFSLEWENDTVFKKRELNYKTKVAFQKDLEAGKISKYTTVFIKDTKEIYKNGQYYGGASSGDSGTGVGKVDSNSDGTGEIFNNYDGENLNISKGSSSHAEGKKTQANSNGSHAEGIETIAGDSTNPKNGKGAHAEGQVTTALGNGSHAEGYQTQALKDCSHAEGYGTKAKNQQAHAEGYYTTATGINSHIEGKSTTQAPEDITDATDANTIIEKWDKSTSVHDAKFSLSHGQFSHAEGYDTLALGNYSHTEGSLNIAKGECSHAEGFFNEASGMNSHAEGNGTEASGDYSHAEGRNTVASGYGSHAEGRGTKASFNSHAEGDSSISRGNTSHAEGKDTISYGDYSHAEGRNTVAYGAYSHIEGGNEYLAKGKTTIDSLEKKDGIYNIICNSNFSTHKNKYIYINNYIFTIIDSIESSEGNGKFNVSIKGLRTTFSINIGSYDYKIYECISVGKFSHAEGNNTTSIGEYSHVEGYYSKSTGSYSHAEGMRCDSIGKCSHSEGSNSISSGMYSHAEGNSTSIGDYSHSSNKSTISDNYAQTSIGSCNLEDSNPNKNNYNSEKTAFVIGNGTSPSLRGDAFKVLFNGKTYADGAYSGSGADYAEMFEWNDGNINNEDRVGLFVSLDCDKIKIAKSTDSNIIGIISGNPSIIGDNPMRWNNKYLTDEWGRIIIEDVEVKYFEDEEYIDENNIESIRKVEKTRIDRVLKLNPDYNNELDYLLRTERKEWDAVGLLGKLLVRQDGTLKVGGYCKPNDNGVATNSDSGYIVMKVINEKQALVLFK